MPFYLLYNARIIVIQGKELAETPVLAGRRCSTAMFRCENTASFVCRKTGQDKTHCAGNISTPGILPPNSSSGNVLTQLATRWQQFNPHFRCGARTPHAQEEETRVVSLPSAPPPPPPLRDGTSVASGKVRVITTECFARETRGGSVLHKHGATLDTIPRSRSDSLRATKRGRRRQQPFPHQSPSYLPITSLPVFHALNVM